MRRPDWALGKYLLNEKQDDGREARAGSEGSRKQGGGEEERGGGTRSLQVKRLLSVKSAVRMEGGGERGE